MKIRKKVEYGLIVYFKTKNANAQKAHEIKKIIFSWKLEY
jgi:hypothetical protein